MLNDPSERVFKFPRLAINDKSRIAIERFNGSDLAFQTNSSNRDKGNIIRRGMFSK